MVELENKVIDIFDEETNKTIETIISSNANQLQVLAANFLKNYNNVKDQIYKIEDYSEKMQQLRHSAKNSQTSLPKEYENLEKERKNLMNKSWWEKVESNANQFQIGLNSLLNQKIATVYVSVSGKKGSKKVSIYELPQGEFIKPSISSSNKLVGRYQVSLKTLKNLQKIIPEESRNIEDLDYTYLTALERYEKMKTHKFYGFYWINSRKKYEMVSVSNKGDIGEAYLNAALGKRKILMGKNIEGNLKRFAKLVVQVDSGSGLLFGDFTGANGIEYAAKSQGASTLGMQQMVDLAKDIITGKIVDEQALRKKQKEYLKEGSVRNKIRKDIDEEIRTILKIDLKN